MKKLFLLLALILLVGCANEGYRVGVIVPLSGSQAVLGNDYRQGLELYDSDIEYIFQDSMGDVKSAVSAYYQLKIQDVDAIVVVSSGDEAIIELADKDDIPLLLTGSSTASLASRSEWAFRYFTNADVDARIIANYAIDELQLKSFGILHVVDNYGYSYAEVFKEEVENNGKKVIGVESFQYADFDYRTQLLKLKDADSIYIIGLDYQIAEALKEINELGINAKVLALGTIATQYGINLSEGTANGVYTNAFCTDEIPELYRTKFMDYYGKEPGFYSEIGYDMAKLIDIANVDGKITKDEFVNNLLMLNNIETNLGNVSAMDDGELFIPVCTKVIEGNKIKDVITGNYYG